jgi:nucleoid-associated protein YgaU
MNKDFKIGLAMGLCLIAAVSLWLAIQPSLSVKARMAEEPVTDQPAVPPQNSETTVQPPPPAADSAQPKSRIHIVQRGETLSAISQQYYRSPNKWQKILDANRAVLKNPDSLTPGTKLIIPD